MRKFLLMCAFTFGISNLSAQNTVVNYPPRYSAGFNSVQGTDGNILSATTFQLNSVTTLGELVVRGQLFDKDLSKLVNFNVYIFKDINDSPSGYPYVVGDALVALDNIPLTSLSFGIDPVAPGATPTYKVTFPVTNINNGNQIVLPAGVYWISVFPIINGTLKPQNIGWYWTGSLFSSVSDAVFVDPADIAGVGATTWTQISPLVGGQPFPTFSLEIIDEPTLSTKKIDESIVSIYPNPVKDVLIIQTKEEVKSIELYDLSGKNIKAKYNNQEVDVSALPSGVYLLKINTAQGTVTKRVVKN